MASRRFRPRAKRLTRFREKGGSVVLISNAPRPGDQVIRLLDHLQRAALGL